MAGDHLASLNFKEFKEMIDFCNKIYISLGTNNKKFLKSEKILHEILSRKIVARNDIKVNKKINIKDLKTVLTYKKKGILPKEIFKIIGKKSKVSIKKGSIINLKNFQNDYSR